MVACRFKFAFLLVLYCIVAGGAAFAEDGVIQRDAAFGSAEGKLTISVEYPDFFDGALRKRLRSGFVTTLVTRIYLYPKGKPKPVAATAYTLKAVYDLWDEKYLLEETTVRGVRKIAFSDEGTLVKRLTSLRRFPICDEARLEQGRNYVAALLVEVNPMSKEVLAEVRRWLRKPVRQQRLGGDNVFGSFVSIFINDKTPRGERVMRLRTQSMSLDR